MKRTAMAVVLLALLTGCGSGTDTTRSTTSRPDLSGWWIWDYQATNDFVGGGLQEPFPLKPEILAKTEKTDKQVLSLFARAMASNASYEDGAGLTAVLSQAYCLPPRFIGAQASEGAVEFLSTPGRITIVDEAGLVRRIALDQPLPAEPPPSNAGTSVGHWDGQTLVVETTGFDGEALIKGQKIGRGARSVERIWLKEPDVLQIDLTLTVPELFSAPYTHTFFYRRDKDHQFADASHCRPNDRSVDPVTRKDRFDLTPPSDLPPPPKD